MFLNKRNNERADQTGLSLADKTAIFNPIHNATHILYNMGLGYNTVNIMNNFG